MCLLAPTGVPTFILVKMWFFLLTSAMYPFLLHSSPPFPPLLSGLGLVKSLPSPSL